MAISIGDRLPEATFLRMGENGPEAVPSATVFAGRKVALFGLPGAYTGVCSTQHVPSFIRAAADLKARGVDAIVCVAVNDPFVMKAWGEATGGTAAGIHFLADADAAFTKAIGLDFTAPPAGLFSRSKRYSAYVVDGEVRALNIEESPGQCSITAGEALVAQI